MAEQRTPGKPRQLLDTALRLVKGDQTSQLVEQFTSEMTLIAEGLCDDQSRLHDALESVRREQESVSTRVQSSVEALERSVLENQRELDRRLDTLGKRLDAMERQLTAVRQDKPRKDGLMRQATILVGILCASWVLVSLLSLLR